MDIQTIIRRFTFSVQGFVGSVTVAWQDWGEECPAVACGSLRAEKFFVVSAHSGINGNGSGEPSVGIVYERMPGKLILRHLPDELQGFWKSTGYRLTPFWPEKAVAAYADGWRNVFSGVTQKSLLEQMQACIRCHGDITYWNTVTNLYYDDGAFFLCEGKPPEIAIVDLTGSPDPPQGNS